tara:strand:- start:172 stop:327 length:156 start_codon:yes stop_codon:yes gene_type:complete
MEEKKEIEEIRHYTDTCGGIENDCSLCCKEFLINHMNKSLDKVFQNKKENE